MESSKRSTFAAMCRDFRNARGLRQRQVAEAVGMSLSTYGNVESSPYRVIGEAKASALAEFFRLAPVPRATFMEQWSTTPFSQFSQDRQARWKKLNEGRNARALLPKVQLALCEVISIHIMAMDEDKICACEFAGDPCEVCGALGVLGLDPYSTRDNAITQLAKLQEKLVAKRDAAKETA